jgi:broad specificity phosphatase PhoE
MSEESTVAERHLILVKHSAPVVALDLPPAQWVLATPGRRRCTALAQRLTGYNIAAIAASDEPKARETAELLAAGFGFLDPLRLDHDLREHERSAADFYPAQGDFQRAVRDLFAHPDKLVFGQETANAARTRFTAAVQRHLTATPSGDLVIVAHGTVITLFVAAHADIELFAFWQSLHLPSFVVLALPDLRLSETVTNIGDEADSRER